MWKLTRLIRASAAYDDWYQLREEEKEPVVCGSFPVLSDGVSGDVGRDFGGLMKRILDCLPRSEVTQSFYRLVDEQSNTYVPDKAMTRQQLKQRFYQAFNLLAIPHPFDSFVHKLSILHVHILQNDDSITPEQFLMSSEHISVLNHWKTQKEYQMNG